MQTTYRVRIWKIEVYKGKRATTYTVRWTVDGAEKRSPHANFPLADAFRSELKQAMSRGEPFDIESGLPLSMLKRASTTTTWYDFATAFVDAKWTRSAGFTRKNRAEALMTVTVALLRAKPTDFKPIDVRIALRTWAFNTALREGAPAEVATILGWVRRNSPTMDTWADPATVRDALDAVATTLDGKPAAGSSVRRKRSVLYNALEYAAVRGIIDNNPIRSVESTPVKTIRAIDKRCVINPAQARELLGYIERRPWGGRRKHAFLATLYYAGLRPEEAAALKVRDLTLPAAGWGRDPRPAGTARGRIELDRFRDAVRHASTQGARRGRDAARTRASRAGNGPARLRPESRLAASTAASAEAGKPTVQRGTRRRALGRGVPPRLGLGTQSGPQ
jgi:integrase